MTPNKTPNKIISIRLQAVIEICPCSKEITNGIKSLMEKHVDDFAKDPLSLITHSDSIVTISGEVILERRLKGIHKPLSDSDSDPLKEISITATLDAIQNGEV